MQEAIAIEKRKIAAIRARKRYSYLQECIIDLEKKIKPHYLMYDVGTESYNICIRIRMKQLNDECQALVEIIKIYLFGEN